MKPGLLFRKKKDPAWFKEVIEEIIPFDNIVQDDYLKLLAVYGIINNDLQYISGYLNSLSNPMPELFQIPFDDLVEEIPVMYNRIYPKYMYHVGQMKNTNLHLDVIPLSDTASEFKREEYNQEVSEFVKAEMEKIQERIVLEFKGLSKEEIDSQIPLEENQPDYDKFTSTVEQFYSDLVEFYHCNFNIKEIYALAAKHILCADRVFGDIKTDGGIPYPVIENTIRYGFQKSPDKLNIQKGDYCHNTTPVTLADAWAEVQHYGTKEDLDKLENYTGSSSTRPNKAWDIASGKAQMQFDYTFVKAARQSGEMSNKNVGQATGNQNNSSYNYDDIIWRTEVQFKGFEQVYFFTYINEYNKEVTEMIPTTFEIPSKAVETLSRNQYGKKTKRWEWIDDFDNPAYIEKGFTPRRYEGVRYGSDIFIKLRECPLQPEEIENFELSCKGRIISNVNSRSISLVERGISSLMQYIHVKKLQNRELSKYKGTQENIDAAQIPDYLSKNDKGEPLFDGIDKLAIHDYFQRILGKTYYDSTYSESGLPNHQRSKPSEFNLANTFTEIINMQNFLELIDREIGIQMLVPPQAEGIYQPYINTTDNQQAYAQGYLMAQEYYDVHAEFQKSLVQEWVNQFRKYYNNYFDEHPDATEISLNYVVPNQGRKVLKILPEYLDFKKIGFFLKSTGQNEEYRQLMMQFGLQPLSQNRGEGAEVISLIMKSLVRNDSPESIHKMIVIASEEQQKRLEKMQKIQSETALRIEQEKTKQEQAKLENNLEEERIKGEYANQRQLIASYAFQQDQDQDKDDIPDQLEALEKIKKIQSEERKLKQGDRKLDIEEKKVKNSLKSSDS